MKRLLLKSLALMTLAFAVFIGLMRAQPQDDTGLRHLLLPPEGCPAPCWQGIRPGITRLNAAAAIMEATSGIEPIERPFRYSGRLASTPINASLIPHPGQRRASSVVEMVRLRFPGLRYGDIQLALGPPDRMLAYDTLQDGYTPFVAAYSHYRLYVLLDMPACDLRQTTLWNATSYVEIFVGSWLEYSSDYYVAWQELDADSWANQLRVLRHCESRRWVEMAAAFGEFMPH